MFVGAAPIESFVAQHLLSPPQCFQGAHRLGFVRCQTELGRELIGQRFQLAVQSCQWFLVFALKPMGRCTVTLESQSGISAQLLRNPWYRLGIFWAKEQQRDNGQPNAGIRIARQPKQKFRV